MERPNARGANNFVVGLFVFVAFLVGAGFIVFMGGSTSFGGESNVRTYFSDVRGLNVGAPVFFSGIQIGRVSGFEFLDQNPSAKVPEDSDGNGVITVLSIYSEHIARIKVDSLASISTQGVLGDKVIVIEPGTSSEKLSEGAMLEAKRSKELSENVTEGGNLVENLNKAAVNLNIVLEQMAKDGSVGAILRDMEKVSRALALATKAMNDKNSTLGAMIHGDDQFTPALAKLNKILEKVNKGEGTLGALVNDSSLHEDLRILLGGAKRSKTVRFLLRQAISASEENQ